MRALKILTIVMAIMIVGATTLLGILIARRISNTTGATPSPASLAAITLDQPAGTHITAITPIGATLALTLQGGGPDRILFLNPKSLQVTARLALSH